MKFLGTALICLFMPVLSAMDSFTIDNKEIDPRLVIQKVVDTRPSNREVMFVNMVLGAVEREIIFNQEALGEVLKELEKTKERRFTKRYNADAQLRHWLMINLKEMSLFCETVEADTLELAAKMDASGHLIAGTLNNTGNTQLLYQIRYLSLQPSKQLTQMENGRWITAGQLAVVMQFEQNQRTRTAAM